MGAGRCEGGKVGADTGVLVGGNVGWAVGSSVGTRVGEGVGFIDKRASAAVGVKLLEKKREKREG